MTENNGIICWAISNGTISCRKQARGIADALGLNAEDKYFPINKPWRWLPSRFTFHAQRLLKKDPYIANGGQWPDLAICCGRRAIPIALALKKLSHGKTQVLFVQNPRVQHQQFDLVIAPEHDGVSGTNVISTFGAVHDITPKRLEQAKQDDHEQFQFIKKPILTILLGGSNRVYTLTKAHALTLIQQIKQIASDYPGSILISTSRRTHQHNYELIKQQLSDYRNVTVINEKTNFSYLSLLAYASHIMVTNDSVSMISEACVTGKPVYLLRLPQYNEQKRRNAPFIQKLLQLGYVRYFSRDIEQWDYPILQEATRIAPLIKQMLAMSSSGQLVDRPTGRERDIVNQ